MQKLVGKLQSQVDSLTKAKGTPAAPTTPAVKQQPTATKEPPKKKEDDEEDVDLFGSDEEEDVRNLLFSCFAKTLYFDTFLSVTILFMSYCNKSF